MVRWDYTDRTPEVGRQAPGHRPAAWDDLIGAMFTTPKELRHLAEQHFGQLFVPTRVLMESPRATVVALAVHELGEFVVHAERPRERYPFQVTRVEWGGSARASA